jgi:hypothetical protein
MKNTTTNEAKLTEWRRMYAQHRATALRTGMTEETFKSKAYGLAGELADGEMVTPWHHVCAAEEVAGLAIQAQKKRAR